jgi:hypothetical protein
MCVVIFNMCILRIALITVFDNVFHTAESLVIVYPITWATCALTFIVIFARLMVSLKDHAMHSGHPEYWS